jgi:hypothetical protein
VIIAQEHLEHVLNIMLVDQPSTFEGAMEQWAKVGAIRVLCVSETSAVERELIDKVYATVEARVKQLLKEGRV